MKMDIKKITGVEDTELMVDITHEDMVIGDEDITEDIVAMGDMGTTKNTRVTKMVYIHCIIINLACTHM